MGDPQLEKWKGWIDGPIQSEILTMHLHRDVWREVADIVSANGRLPDSYWWEFMKDTYSNSQVVAVRRQIDLDSRVSSLGRLILEIGEQPELVSKEHWLSLWDDDPGPRAENGWNKAYAGSVGTHLDPAIPTADSKELARLGKEVRRYVNSHIAHAQAKAQSPAVTLTLEEVHEAIDGIGLLFAKYYEMLMAGSFFDLVPTIQHDWKAVFRQPWLRAGMDGLSA